MQDNNNRNKKRRKKTTRNKRQLKHATNKRFARVFRRASAENARVFRRLLAI